MGSTFDGRHGLALSRRALVALLALLCLSLLVPGLAGAEPPSGDAGDAPDSTNHAGVGMLAYPGVPANFPTVFDPMVGAVQGPYHHSPRANGWLGADVSIEADADLLPDADGFRNINPVANSANRDRFDDGVAMNILLPQCQQTQFAYQVTGAAAVPAPVGYVNVWIDWNRDGDWADVFTCMSEGGAVAVPEWAVQNQPVNIAPGSAGWVTPPFVSYHAAGTMWMRITLAEGTAPLSPATGRADGRGPNAGYTYGETEDYLLHPLGNNHYEPSGSDAVDGD